LAKVGKSIAVHRGAPHDHSALLPIGPVAGLNENAQATDRRTLARFAKLSHRQFVALVGFARGG